MEKGPRSEPERRGGHESRSERAPMRRKRREVERGKGRQ